MVRKDGMLLLPLLAVDFINCPRGTKEHIVCCCTIREMARLYFRGWKDGHLARGQEALAEFAKSPLTKIGMDGEGKFLINNLN